ncbi:MAG TPA: ferrous iron transport protein B [Planctomycetota bacterium]|nr:ferrous iron transport protein B [Planctomycetota bacterium]
MRESKKNKRSTPHVVAVIGNPNTGKSTLFNAMTGLKQHVGNYPGVTVERKVGTAQLDAKTTVELIDLPGTYSLAARSPDEMIAVDVLLNQLPGSPSVDAILAIADASNPERNFYLISQLLELNLPVVVAMNMLDVAQSKGIQVDTKKIEETLGVKVVGICANKGKGMEQLKAALVKTLEKKKPPQGKLPIFPTTMNTEIDGLLAELNAQQGKIGRSINRLEAFRALVDKGGHAETRLAAKLGNGFPDQLETRRKRASAAPLPAEEVRVRYKWVKDALSSALTRPAQPPATKSDTIDKWVTHWFSGSLIFLALMFVVFESIFFAARPVMDVISWCFDSLAVAVANVIPEGALQSLLAKGVIKGVGGVLVFLPQIAFLFLFIAIMEDCGYMARAAFLMDRLLSRVGLSGKSFIPMLSSFACAVPGIMATRTIENWRDRLTTIMVAPLMSCSARLPVYGLMIAAFIPSTGWLHGWLGLQGLVLFAMYFVGIIVAIPVAWILKKTLLRGETPPFLIELPSYKIPDWWGVLLRVWDRAKAFIVRAGTIILAVSIVVWALAYFPHSKEIETRYEAHVQSLQAENTAIIKREMDPLKEEWMQKAMKGATESARKFDEDRDKALKELGPRDEDAEPDEKVKAILQEHAKAMHDLSELTGVKQIWDRFMTIRKANEEYDKRIEEMKKEKDGEYLRTSYFGSMGKFVEPVFKPLGWDWRISMGAIASFPAREVIVATLGTIFNQGEDVEAESKSLQAELQRSTWDGQPQRKLFNIPVALSIMVFFALCSQCAATLATIKRETNSWKWPVFSFTYMTVLAYLAAMATYQIGMKLVQG